MAWEVDNLTAAVERLKSANIAVTVEPQVIKSGLWRGARAAFFLDPDGICTGLVEIEHRPGGKGRLLGLHHTTFTLTSIDSALDIFCGKLCLKLDPVAPGSDSASLRKVYLSLPNTSHKMEFLEYLTPAGPAADMATNNLGSGHLCFQVDNIHTTYDELCMVGVEFVGTPTEITAGVNKGGFATYFKGVDRIRFELFQKPKPAV